MKLIKHIIFVDIGDGKKLMINSLEGTVDKIDSSIYMTISNWQPSNKIVPFNDKELALYKVLMNRGYLTNSDEEEARKKDSIIAGMRNNAEIMTKNNSHMTIIITYDCNFACQYCFEHSITRENQSKKHTAITSEMVDAAFALTGKNLKTIGLFGGEPLLPKNRDVLEYIVSKAGKDVVYNVTTNGYYLTEFTNLFSNVNVSSIMVTLDGDRDTHNNRRFLKSGKPTYDKILEGISICLKNKIPICVRMNLDESNYEECILLKERLLQRFSQDNEILSFEISPMIDWDSEKRNKMFEKLYDSDIEYSKDERQKRNRFLSRFSPIVNAITAGEKLRPVYSFCQAHENGYLVDPFGYIYPCLLSVGVKDLAIGKYYPTIEFFENTIRNRNIERIQECRECIYSLLCGGGCPLALEDYKDVFKPVCFNIKDQINNVLPAFYNLETKGR